MTEAPPKKAEREKTGYVVLRFTGEGNHDDQTAKPFLYAIVGREIPADNTEQAIRRYLERATSAEAKEGLFVAVPARSWKPITVKTETKTVVTLVNGETG